MNVLGIGTLGTLAGLPVTNISAPPIRILARLSNTATTSIIQSKGSIRNSERIKGATGSIAFSVIAAKIRAITFAKNATVHSTILVNGAIKSVSSALGANTSSLIASKGNISELSRIKGATLTDIAVAIIPGIIKNLIILKGANATVTISSSGTIRAIAKVFNYKLVISGIEKIYLALR
jgi:hypothetical protein